MEGAFTAPRIKVRKDEPKRLDESSRKAWSFYLLNMQERLVGTGHDQGVRDAIESLLKNDRLKISVGILLNTLQHLMLAEQARLAGANSYVKRWLANEKTVLQLGSRMIPAMNSRKKKIGKETRC